MSRGRNINSNICNNNQLGNNQEVIRQTRNEFYNHLQRVQNLHASIQSRSQFRHSSSNSLAQTNQSQSHHDLQNLNQAHVSPNQASKFVQISARQVFSLLKKSEPPIEPEPLNNYASVQYSSNSLNQEHNPSSLVSVGESIIVHVRIQEISIKPSKNLKVVHFDLKTC